MNPDESFLIPIMMNGVIKKVDYKCFISKTTKRSRLDVRDKPMSCKPGVAGSIPGFSQSVG